MRSPRSSSPRVLPMYLLFGIMLGSAKAALYEQGGHQAGEKLTFTFLGLIPAWMNQFEMKVAHNDKNVERVYNYFRVDVSETSNPLKLKYDTKNMYVSVQVEPKPFERGIIMTGYALPKPKLIETTTRRTFTWARSPLIMYTNNPQ